MISLRRSGGCCVPVPLEISTPRQQIRLTVLRTMRFSPLDHSASHSASGAAVSRYCSAPPGMHRGLVGLKRWFGTEGF
jgi:hypothetical protein